MLRVNQGSQLRQDHLRDRHQVTLALQHSREPGEVRLEPVLFSVLLRRLLEVADHLVDVVLEDRDFSARLNADGSRQVAFGHGRRHFGDGAHLRGERGRQLVYVVGQVAPRAGGARHFGLTAETSLDAHLARDSGDLLGKHGERVSHAVDGFDKLGDLALRLERQLAFEASIGDRRDHASDAAHLVGEVARHRVDVVGQVLPYTGYAFHSCLAAELALGTNLTRDTGHLIGEGVEKVDHGVDGVLELEDLALNVDGDFLGEVAFRDRGHDAGNSAHLLRELTGHHVDVVRQLLPHARHTLDLGLAAELALGTNLTRDTGHLIGEGVELVDHRVDGFFELEDLALAFDGDLLRDVALGDRGRHLCDVADLAGQVACHRVHVVGEIFPDAAHALDFCLTTKPPFGAHLAGDTRHLVGEGVELVDHGVDGVLQLEDLSPHVDGDLLGEVAIGDGSRDVGDVADLAGQVAGHQVHVVGQVLPYTRYAAYLGLAAELAFGAHLAGHASHLVGEGVELVDHGVDGVLQLEDLAANIDGDLLGEVAVGDGGRDVGDVAHLAGQVAGHQVHVVGQVFPDAAYTLHIRLATEASFSAHLAGHASHLVGEGVELVDHGVDGVLQLEDLAANVDGDLLGEVAIGDRGRDLGDVANLAGQVAGHQVHVVGEVLPDTSHAFDLSLTTQLSFGAYFASDTSHFIREGVQLVDHGVHGLSRVEELALQRFAVDLKRHGLG